MKKAKISKQVAKKIMFFKPRRILQTLMLCLSVVLMLSFSFAWFSGREFSFNTDKNDPLGVLATLENKVDVIGYSLVDSNDGDTIAVTNFTKTPNEDGRNKFIDVDYFVPGSLNNATTAEVNAIIERNTNTKYIKVTNRSDMDIKVSTKFSILDKDKDNLTAFWYLISDVTEDIVKTNITDYSGTLTDEERKVLAYGTRNKSSRTLNSYNENNINVRTLDNLDKAFTLGVISEASNHEIGNTRYFRLDYGLCEAALRSSGATYFNQEIKVDVFIYYGQVNAPDDEGGEVHNNIKLVSTAEEFMNILQNVNLAYHGDTIRLMDDIEVNPLDGHQSIDLTRPLNLDLNGHKLTINGDFNINYTAETDITVDASRVGQLFVKGNMNINTPKAEVKLVGSNQRAAGVDAYDYLIYGKIYNGVGRLDESLTGGLTLDNTYIICKEKNSSTGTYFDANEAVVMQANSKLTVGEGVIIDEVSSGEISGVHINNYGTIGWIHLESMVLPNIQSLQIIIYNNGLLSGITYVGTTQITHSSAITLPISSTTVNTKIIKGIYSNNFYVDGSTNFTNGNVISEELETQYVTKIKNETNAYRVYLDLTVGKTNNSILKYAIENYFSYNGEVNEDSIKAIEKLVIESTTDTYINENDFTYLNSASFRDLKYLDLTNANVQSTKYAVENQRTNRIPDKALLGKSSIQTLLLPSSIKYIGNQAFYNTGITSIQIPSLVESIGTNAFNTVSEVNLKAFYPLENDKFLPAFGNEVYYLVDETVVDAYKAKFAEYRNNGQYRANHVYCYSTLFEDRYIRLLEDGTLEIVAFTGDISDGDIVPTTIEYDGNSLVVSSIGRDAYINTKNEAGLTLSLYIGQGVQKIGKNSFAGLNSLQTVTITDAALIDSNAFANCSALQKVTIGGEARINENAFHKCSSIEELNMEGVVYIEDNAFNGCSSIETLVIPNVTYLGESAFAGCTSFKNVVLGKIEKISDGTFENCKLLEIVGLTDSTIEIGANAFKGCEKLVTIYTYDGEQVTGYIYLQYIKDIDESAFENCKSIKYVVCDAIENIGTKAFYSATNLQYVEANTLKTIGEEAFVNCSSLAQIEMDGVQTIGANAFNSVKSLKYAIMPNVVNVGANAFNACDGISVLAFGKFQAGSNAFKGVHPDYVDLSSYKFTSTDKSTNESMGTTRNWHEFSRSTKYYFDAGSSLTDTNNRKEFLAKIISNSYDDIKIDSLIRNSIFSKETIMGDNSYQTEDYAIGDSVNGFGNRNYFGISRNLGLYNVDVDTQTLVSYHGPALVGYNVLPFSSYSSTGITKEEFDRVLNGEDTTAGLISDDNQPVYITKIGDYAFYGVEGKKNGDDFCTICFAPSVDTIGVSAFQTSTIQFLYCNKAKDIKLNAFRATTELRFVDLGDVTTIGLYAFAGLNPTINSSDGTMINDGSDVRNYFSNTKVLSFSNSKLTKVIFRHVNEIGEAAFMRNPSGGLMVCDFTNNVPVEGANNGYGPNNNVNIPTTFGVNWLGYGVGTSYYVNDFEYNISRDTYVLAPYDKARHNAVVGSFGTFARSEQLLYDYGYWYNPNYKVNDVEVGMFLLKPPEGSLDQGLYLYKSFVRNIGETSNNGENGELIEGLSKVEGSSVRLLYEVPGSLDASKIVAKDYAEALTKTSYQVRLSSYAYRNTTVKSGYVCDLSFGEQLTEVPSYCFLSSDISNVYANNVETLQTYSFARCELGTLYAYHINSIKANFNDRGSIKVIDARQNRYKENPEDPLAGKVLVINFDSGFMINSTINAIYTTEESYDAYVEATKNVIYARKINNRDLDTDLELYMYVTIPGMYIGTLDLVNTSTYDFSGLISPYTTNDNETIIWESSNNSVIKIDQGVVSVATTNGEPAFSGESNIYCYKEKITQDGTSKELLCKFKVNIASETKLTYYNLIVKREAVKNSTTQEETINKSFKIVKYSGDINISNGIFDPAIHLTDFLDGVLDSNDFTKFNESLDITKTNYHSDIGKNIYKVSEIGIASFYGSKIDTDAYVYLVTDNQVKKIGDYAFYQVPFYELWLRNVTEIGRKAFLNGAAVNNLVQVVMPYIQSIGYEAFSQNRNLITVVYSGGKTKNSQSANLKTIDSNAFYANSSLKHFGVVKETTSDITKEQILAHDYHFTFAKELKTIVDEEETYVTTYHYELEFYETDTNASFIFLMNPLTTLGSYAFYQNIAVEELSLPRISSLKSIGSYAFGLCKSLKLVRTYQYTTDVGDYAFYGCESLPDYKEDEDGNQIEGISFKYFKTIGAFSFRQCYQFREIHFGAIEEIGNQAFFSCINLRFLYYDNEKIAKNVKFGTNWNSGCHDLLRNYVPADSSNYYSDAINTYVREKLGYRQDDTDHKYEYVVNYIYDAYDNILGVKIACYNGIVENVPNDNVLENIPDYLVVDGQIQPVLAIGKYAYKGFNAQELVPIIELPTSVSLVESYAFYDCEFKEYVEKIDNTNIVPVDYGSYVFANNPLLTRATFKRMATGGSRFFDNTSVFKTMDLTNNINQYGIYIAPVIADDFFTGSRNDATCTIANGKIDLFGAVGYIGRVFEDGDTYGDYKVKRITVDGVTKYQIIDYIPGEIRNDFIIPDKIDNVEVASIGMSAFANTIVLPGITLTIPSNITSIETYAFYRVGFTNVVIQGNNVTFGDDVFAENTSLKSVDLSKVTNLTGTGLFRNDTMLSDVKLNENNLVIPKYYFYGCTNLLTLDIYKVTEIQDYAFASCTALTSLYSSTSSIEQELGKVDVGYVMTVGDYAFDGDKSIQKLDLRMANDIGAYAFRNNTSLTNVASIMSDAVLGNGTFYGCTKLEKFNATFAAIPDDCFYGCTSLANVVFTNAATSIGARAFYNNTSLTSIKLTSVQTIGDSAFYGCKNVTELDLGRTNKIGNSAFYECKGLTSIDLKTVQTIGNNAFNYCSLKGTLDLKNVNYLGTYAFANNIKLVDVYFRNVSTISGLAFQNDVAIENLFFDENTITSNSIPTIGAPTSAAKNCFDSINDTFIIFVPVNNSTVYNNYVTQFANYKPHIFEHGYYATSDSNYLLKEKTDGTIEIIRYFGNTIPTNYTVPQTFDGKKVTSIGNYAYYYLQNNENLVTEVLNLGSNIESVGNYAFYNLDFATIALTGVKTIGEYAFANNDKLTYLSLPSATKVGKYAFYNNNQLQIVRFYDNINSIGDHAFDDCEDLRNVYFSSTNPSQITYSNTGYVFGKLETSNVNLRVPSGTLDGYKTKFAYYANRIFEGQIDDGDFSYRISTDGVEIISYEGQASSVTVPSTIANKNVVKILDGAFSNSLNLESVTLPSTLTSISSHAFIGNTSIQYISVANGSNTFVAVDNVLYMKNSSNVITTLIYYPVAKKDLTTYSFTSSSTYNLDNVNMIYENAFYGNPYLKDLVIPSSVRYIGECAFTDMPSLETVTFANPTSGQAFVPILYGTNLFDITVDDIVIYVPSSVLTLYKNDEFFSYYRRFIQAIA